MKIRRYMGNDVQEALLKLKMDLGNDAVILNTRKIKRKGIKGLLKKPMVEVLAAIDDDYSKPKRVVQSEGDIRPHQLIEQKDNDINALEKKVEDMELLLKKILNQLQTRDTSSNTLWQDIELEDADSPKILQLFFNNLLINDVEPAIAKELVRNVKQKQNSNSSVSEVVNSIYNEISSILGEPEEISLKEGRPTVVIFVGPTGVGKTTTLAKIAAHFALNLNKNVGLITADTYRIAAIEQLRTYAEILGIPLTVVYTPSEIIQAINSFSDKDLVLIDTAGRSHRNNAQFEELKALVSATKPDEAYLLLSASTSVKVCKEILSKYEFLKDYKIIFTKVDESPVYGIILNISKLTGKKLSYITNGQNVPDDIEKVNTDKIAKSLLGRMLND